jgi:serine/threonine protein kinase
LKYKRTPATRVYSPQGIMLHDDDVLYLRNGDILYYDYKGRDFDSKQVVDQYEREALIGEGGFGRVYRGRHKESGEIVALKYQDLG